MAIQISGTTVINNSRQLQNIASLDSTTTSTISSASSPSTTDGAVGTYMFANNNSGGAVTTGTTVAGSSLRPTSAGDPSYTSYSMSGTWRLMGYKQGGNTNFGGEWESSLFVRIS